ncbi:MAG: cell division protein ZapA [Dokdonella sp.]|jgi:cell division protein ZapA|uniref:cell division protein ZapA n=1 Tax=Dokdonella sp. TaxID=2291710 RepID=UPI001B5564D5|nr:cell division protein ZapA [Dokdonella sp.]MCC6439081.1 cell division protein ZapA [Rhodanobacteraceae bacterium]MBP6327925.1 cell division protein ZapA [Dokdonella sp.]MBP6330580.1 cell division protein ZapA [Dokdonella sp.]HNV08628.1 cell division protein ZapA [Dokdonella sp.]HPW04279.1 cell division protein ZapA [Dokdonella sp.]
MSNPVAVRILDREYLIACTPEERAGLVAAAAYLDGKLRELRESHRGGTLDRIAVLAGLNIAHELLEARQTRSTTDSNLAQHLQVLKMKLDAGLPSSLQ